MILTFVDKEFTVFEDTMPKIHYVNLQDSIKIDKEEWPLMQSPVPNVHGTMLLEEAADTKLQLILS